MEVCILCMCFQLYLTLQYGLNRGIAHSIPKHCLLLRLEGKMVLHQVHDHCGLVNKISNIQHIHAMPDSKVCNMDPNRDQC